MNAGPKLGGPTLKQPSFNWSMRDKYAELKNFQIEVNYIFQTYDASSAERVLMMKNRLDKEGIQFFHTLNRTEQETCETVDRLFGSL